jgi:uncharacterized protein
LVRKTEQFGSLRAEPGQKVTGFIDAAERPGSAIRWPAGLINGAQDGPRLSITAGVHGTEYVAQEAAIRTFRSLDPADVKGSIAFIFIVNVPGWEAAETFANPMDGQNLNRIFPGNPQGTISFVIAHRLIELLSNWGQWHIDMHGGDATEWLNPFAIYHKVDNAEVSQTSERIARLWDTEVVWATTHQFGYPGTLVGELSSRGIPSIVAESGYLSTYSEPEIAVHLKGARNVMRAFGLLDGEPELTHGDRQRVVTENWVAYATRGGVFHPQAKPGDRVREGQILAVIKDVFGEPIEEIKSPATGLVRIQHPRRVVNTGNPVFRGWAIAE